ncbi:Site-specific DNA recombinase [Sphingomonas laterariae]|uniref:Site-specific DNA recombinase n=1 Tax=Edaphosphingomonas laterariae TaxID=861865 RepID=A0A239GEA9_9SPHN|nr:recombinase family protein [Sphingomonas laterariae]SNS67480.1 Site-specific DNA recombinase [Sphingomonas laterariae]
MARPRTAPKRKVKRAVDAFAARKAVLYARVSTADQEREGFSIPAQIKLLQEYAALNDINVVSEHIDVETAKKAGRTEFEAMLAYLRRHPTVRIILVEKTDRLYRNFKDYVTLDELDVEVHLVKEGVVLSAESRSSEKFMHGIKVLMAKNYIDNLSEEARKGMNEKAAQGYWPTLAPLGYRNVRNDVGKKVIEIDPETAPIIVQLFDLCGTGNYSMKELAGKARELGLKYRRSGKPVGTSTLLYVLRNRIYTGSYEWNGKLYRGLHAPIISLETWENAQEIIDGRSAANLRAKPVEFTYTGLMTCGHCGCAIVAELKKKKYIYYHCTGFKGKCPEPYVRQEILDTYFENVLARLRLDDEVFGLVQRALREGHADERRDREARKEKLIAEASQLQDRLDMIYLDKVEGRITAEFHDRISVTWRDERARAIRGLELLSNADDAYVDDSIALLDVVRTAHKGFADMAVGHKRRALNLVLSNCSWADGSLSVGFREPFGMLEELSKNALLLGGQISTAGDCHDSLVTPTGIEPDFGDTTGDRRGNKPLFFNSQLALDYPPLP